MIDDIYVKTGFAYAGAVVLLALVLTFVSG